MFTAAWWDQCFHTPYNWRIFCSCCPQYHRVKRRQGRGEGGVDGACWSAWASWDSFHAVWLWLCWVFLSCLMWLHPSLGQLQHLHGNLRCAKASTAEDHQFQSELLTPTGNTLSIGQFIIVEAIPSCYVTQKAGPSYLQISFHPLGLNRATFVFDHKADAIAFIWVLTKTKQTSHCSDHSIWGSTLRSRTNFLCR